MRDERLLNLSSLIVGLAHAVYFTSCLVFFTRRPKNTRAVAKSISVGVRGPTAPEISIFVGQVGGRAAHLPHKKRGCEGLCPSRSQLCNSPAKNAIQKT